MQIKQKTAIEKYLNELEYFIKRCDGVYPKEVIADAHEHLFRFEKDAKCQGEVDEEALYQLYCQQFGTPETIANQFQQVARRPLNLPGFAPGWRISCPKCGRSKPLAKAGAVRIGARSISKKVLGWCSGCGWLRWLKVTRDLNKPNLSESSLKSYGSDKEQLLP